MPPSLHQTDSSPPRTSGAARLLVLLAFFWLSHACLAAEISGRVVRVADGDTITVLDNNKTQHKVRLAGVDAPEKAQAFGERSRESLDELVAGRIVIVESNKRDRYGRTVGKILLNGQDINFEQVRRGMAWHYKAYANEQSPEDRSLYDAAEVEARQARRGLWADRTPVPPWDFRQQGRRP